MRIKEKKKISRANDPMVGRGKAMHALQRLFGFVSRERERENKKGRERQTQMEKGDAHATGGKKGSYGALGE